MRYSGIGRKGWSVVEEVGDGIGASGGWGSGDGEGEMGKSGGRIFCGGVEEDSYKLCYFVELLYIYGCFCLKMKHG